MILIKLVRSIRTKEEGDALGVITHDRIIFSSKNPQEPIGIKMNQQ